MIKIDVDGVKLNKIKSLFDGFFNIYQISIKIEKLIELLIAKNCNETAKILEDETKDNKLFLLNSKQSLKEAMKRFDNAIEVDSKANKNVDILKILKHGQEEIKDKNKNIVKEKVFGFFDFYRTFSNSDQAYEILRTLNVNVCPYCNRQFTFTVRKKDKNNDVRSRAQFDHYFPKYINPYLALSIYNLVPSCGLCNQGKSNTDSEKFLYPYEESFEDKGIYFKIDPINILLKNDSSKNNVELEPKDIHKELINQYNTSFKIELLYNKHEHYISELLYKNYIFNDDTIEMIFNSFSEVVVSQSDLKKKILGNVEPENFNQRPLSKLTSDILRQIN